MLTQSELARLLGVATNTIARWESGENSPTARHLRVLTAAFPDDAERILSALVVDQ